MTIYADNAGFRIVLDVQQDILDATVMRIVYKKPSGATGRWEAVRRGFKEIVATISQADIDEAGTWEIQAYVETPNWSGYGDKTELVVAQNIETS